MSKFTQIRLILTVSTLLCFSSAIGQDRWSDASSDMGRDANVMILDIVGSKNPRDDLNQFERHLSDTGLIVTSHNQLLRLARDLRLRKEDIEEPNVLRMLSKRLRVDFFVVLDFIDRSELRLSVLNGVDGREIWSKRFGLPSDGNLRDRHWYALSQQVARQIRGRSPSPVVGPRATTERGMSARGSKTFSIYGGAIALSRTFAASGVQSVDNPLTGGINYSLGFVPGFALEAEMTPLKNVPSFGIGIGYEQAFFRTKQTTSIPISNGSGESSSSTVKLLDSGYSQIFTRAFYRKILDSGIELTGGLMTRIISFNIAEESDYRGVKYLTLDFELDSFLPVYRRSFGLCFGGSIAPAVGFRDTIGELGAQHSTVGFSAKGGLAFRGDSGFSLKAMAQYANFSSDIQGSGRDGRMIEQALDQYITLKLLGGFIY